jgi:sec-independent protein translocase protein TatA
MGRIGGGELLLILLIALVLFGPSKLSELGKGLGEGLKNFKKGMSDPQPSDPKPAQAAALPAAAPAAEQKPAEPTNGVKS